MAVNGSIGRGAATAALACVLGVSMAPAVAHADADAVPDGESSSKVAMQENALGASSDGQQVGQAGSGSGSDATGVGSGNSGQGGSGASDGDQGESGSESGSGQGGSGSGSGAGSESGEQGSGQGGESGSGSGQGAGSGESGSGSGQGAGSGEGAGQGNQGAGSGSGGKEDSDKPADAQKTVLDLSASSTTVTVADVTVGQTPVVKVAFAGGSARAVTSGSAFTVTFFGPDGNKTQSFDEPGRYSVRVQAASNGATTSAGEVVKGKSSLVFFQVKEEQAGQSQDSGSEGASSGSAKDDDGRSDGKQNANATSQDSGQNASSGTAEAKGASATAEDSKAKDSSKDSVAAGKTADSAGAKKKTTRTYRYVASGGGGGVTYLAPVNLTSSSTAAGGAARAVASSVAGAAASGQQGASASHNLDEASTDVSAVITQAAGAEVLFWGGGTQVAPGYIWSVDTSALTRDDAFGLDLKVASSDAAGRVAKDLDAVAFKVGPSGSLPSGLRLFWRTSSVFFDGESVDVYRIDPQTGECAVVAQGIQTADGYVGFDVTEGGEYVVVEAGADLGEHSKLPSITEVVMPAEAYADSPAAEPEAQIAGDDGVPSSDLWALPAGIAAACASAAGVWFAMRRKLKTVLEGADAGAHDE